MVPGVRVQAGKISKSHRLYIFRNGTPATQGYFPKAIKVFKKEMGEVKKGDECTITMDVDDGFIIEKGDYVVAYEE